MGGQLHRVGLQAVCLGARARQLVAEMFRFGGERFELAFHGRQIFRHGRPDDAHIDLVVAVSDGIAHFVSG